MSQSQKDRIKIFEKRLGYLNQVIKNSADRNPRYLSYIYAEINAIEWALDILKDHVQGLHIRVLRDSEPQ